MLHLLIKQVFRCHFGLFTSFPGGIPPRIFRFAPHELTMRARPYKYLFLGQKLHGKLQPLRQNGARAGRQSQKCKPGSGPPWSSCDVCGVWGRGPRSASEGRIARPRRPGNAPALPPDRWRTQGRDGGRGTHATRAPGPPAFPRKTRTLVLVQGQKNKLLGIGQPPITRSL